MTTIVKTLTVNEMLGQLRKAGIEIFADDNGHRWHKGTYQRPDGTLKTLKIPSLVGNMSENRLEDLSKRPIKTYTIGDTALVCSDDLRYPLDIRVESYQSSVENQALIAALIDRAGLFDKRIILGTTTPIRRQGQEALIAEIRGNFKSRQTVRSNDEKLLEIVDVVNYGEGLMAYYDWIFGNDLKVSKNAIQSPKNLVIDIGGGTSDVVTVKRDGNGISIDNSQTNTIEGFGIIDIVNDLSIQLNRLVEAAFKEAGKANFFRALASHEIESIIRNDGLWTSQAFGFSVDASKEVTARKERFVSDLIERVLSVAGNINSYDKIIFVGGGAKLLVAELKKSFPSAVFLDEYANSKGLYKVISLFWVPAEFERLMDTRNSTCEG